MSIIGKQLYILDINSSDSNEEEYKVKFKDRDIAHVLLDAINFPLVGGESALFHRAFVNGILLDSDGELLLDVGSIVIEDKQLNQDGTLSIIRIPVDISATAIEASRQRDPSLFIDNPSGDWMDYM